MRAIDDPATHLDDPAAYHRAIGRHETPSPDRQRILLGHFDEGAEYRTWRTRGTDDWLVILTVAGAGRFGGAGDLVTEPGDVVAIAPGELHDYATHVPVGRWELLWAHVVSRPEWLPLLEWPRSSGRRRVRLRGGVLGEVRSAFDAALRASRSASPTSQLRALNAFERVVLDCAAAAGHGPGRDERIDDAVRFVLDHLGEPIDVARLAERCHLSVSHFAHRFRDVVGMSPQQYVESCRMHQAAQLLTFTRRSVTSIAQTVGYPDPFYFSVRFRRFSGLAPSEYRRRAGGVR